MTFANFEQLANFIGSAVIALRRGGNRIDRIELAGGEHLSAGTVVIAASPHRFGYRRIAENRLLPEINVV